MPTRHIDTEMIAQNIQALMDHRGMNAAEVARIGGLNPTAVYDILKRKIANPRIDTLVKIAGALQIPVTLLFEGKTDDGLRAEANALFGQLPADEQERFLATLRLWLAD